MCTEITIPESAQFDIDIGAKTHLIEISSIFNKFKFQKAFVLSMIAILVPNDFCKENT